MLELLNRYAHGLSSIPILHALRERGCLARLAETPLSAAQMAREFSANRGYLDVALRMMVCLEWLRPLADGRFEATPEMASATLIPESIMDLYRFPFGLYVQGSGGESLEPWLTQSERHWNSEHPYLPDYLDGLLIIPLLLSLRAKGGLRVTDETLHLDVDPQVRGAVERLFVAKGWASRAGELFRVNRIGRFVIDRIFITATVASYKPMFEQAHELLFGDAARVFGRDEAGHEIHVDRTVNVIGSGFQHEKFFAALSDLVVRCFDDEDYESQPKYIVDMGCGDGTLLRRLYEAIRDRTRRGKVLDVHPVIPVAADFNEKALVEASRTLADIEHLAVRGDIGDPAALIDTLRTIGVEDLHRVLHVRSFLDHDRPYKEPEDRQAAERRPQDGGNVYIDSKGQLIPLGDMLQSTVEHLRRWSQVINAHGLVMLEVHCLPPEVTARYRDESENFHFDVYHALSHQFLLNAHTFLACAAEANLFWRDGRGVGFPRHLPYTRISLNHFERRPYQVRRALREDLPALAQLREVWPERRPRVDAGEGEFLLEIEGRVMASVRCDEREGTVRLVSACAQPGAPASHLRDLLQFVKQYWALTDVGAIAGLAECRAALATTDGETSVARIVARDVLARVAAYPFAVEYDPLAAERELGTFSFRWLLANLQRAGVMREAGQVYDLDALGRQLGVAAKYHRYFDALVRRLQDEGLLTVHGRRVETTPRVVDYALTSVEEQVAEFKRYFAERFPANVGLLNLTARCLERFDEIITGRIAITDVVFQDANMDVFTEIFRGGIVSDYFNRIVADAVHEAIVHLQPTVPKIRILEIGAGTGATSSAILEVLEPFLESVEFCFSDISQSFLRNARRRFADRYPSIEYRLLDIEEDLARQGFETHHYDIVVAGNVLHDTRNVDLALKRVRRLLKPGGILVMDEYTAVKDCLFFSGALLHGYWLFQDPEKRLRDSCLLDVPQWISALGRTGFGVVGAHALPTQSLDASCSQSVMLGEALGLDDAEELPSHGQTAKAEIIGAFIEQQTLELLGKERASAYAAQRPVMDMGLDSLELVELKSLMERGLGVKLTPMFLFEHETPEKLTTALSGMVSDQRLQGLSASASAGHKESPPSDAVSPPAQEIKPAQPPVQVMKATDRTGGLHKSEIVGAFVEKQALELLGIERASAYSAQRPVMDMGLDSLELVELKSLLERGLAVKLTPMFLFEHETPEKLTAALSNLVSDSQLERLSPRASEGVGRDRAAANAIADRPVASLIADLPSQPERADKAATEDDAIAIVGVACRFPGGAASAESFWKLLESGKSGIVPMPAGRWRWPAFIDLAGKHKGIDQAGFLDRIDEFDAPFFRTSPKEANLMDPQQRLLLELSWEAMEDGGHRPSEISGRKIGVFVGVCHYDYREVMTAAADSADAYVGTGSALSLLSNRLSYFYDFKGPSMTVDTACSSSLFALHHAVSAIRRGDCEQALVGAANLLCSATNSISYYRAGMLSPTGTCRTFDEAADGYVRGEGGAMLLIKPLAQALADGDAIYGLVKGTAVNHGGQAASLTAPKPEAQAAVIEAAWQEANVALESIGYIEAHGTGTRLGDPVEIGGLIEAFERLYRARGEAWPGTRHCGLGSVKTAIGHLEGAAGLAGLIKVLLAMQHRSIPATLNLQRLNPDIDLTDSPFYVVDKNEAWPTPRDDRGRELPRRAGVSSFGFGGSNSHAVVEEYRTSSRDVAEERGPILIPLSARNEERLVEQAKRLLEFLISAISADDPSSAPRLADVAYTLQVGREPMEERVAFVVRSREELMAALHTWLAGNCTLPHCFRGHADQRRARAGTAAADEWRQEIDTSIAKRDLTKLASLWVEGAEFDWTRLSVGGTSRRTHLPTYPFAKERYWIETVATEPGRASAVPSFGAYHPLMHPLLHANSSNLSQQSYSATFSGEEFFLLDHQVRVDGQTVQKVLPGVAYLEMARAAIDQALPGRPESTILELRNTAWVQPIVVTGKKQVSIALLANDNDQIDFDFFSQDAEQETVHCQGRAVLTHQAPPPPLDVELLRERMVEGRLEAVSVYVACARKGLVYGPSFQALTRIDRGRNELLASLRLPKTVEDTSEDYVLHPSLMDGALQAAFVLIENDADSDRLRLPFALESLRIIAPCTREMIAWVRYAPGSGAGDNVVKLDIDLCDEHGTVCAQMHGLSLREPIKETPPAAVQTAATECLLVTPGWQAGSLQPIDIEYTEHHVVLCELAKFNVETLQTLIPQSQCLSLQLAPPKTIAQRYSEYALASFERIQAILLGKPQGKALVQIVVPDHQEQAIMAGLSGLLQTATLENPLLIGQVIMVGPQTTAEELARQLGEEKAHGLDPLVKYAHGARQVWRWKEVGSDADKPPLAFKDHGVYLITGGLGGLGILFAKEILEHTRLARVVLTGRSGLSNARQALLDGLSSQPGRVSYRPVNLDDYDQVKRLIAAIREEYQQLNGILHSAGMIADDFILNKSGSQFAEVLGPKVGGTYNLDKASQDVELDFFVLFSSIVGPMGNVGQADYAAANGFLDHFAAYRNGQVAAKQRRGRTRAINWPLWQAGGMIMDAATRERLQEATGMEPMRTETGMHAFHRCLALPYDQILVMEGDSAQIRRALLSAPAVPVEAQVQQSVAPTEIEKKTLEEKTQKYLRKQFSGVLKLPAHKIDPQAGLREYGIDSILAMELINELEQTFGSLSKTLFFEYQSIRELAEYFGAHHSPRLNALFAATAHHASEAAPAAAPVRAPASRTASSSRRFIHARAGGPSPATESEPIAIIGLSGRYPEAVDIEAYWNNLRDGKDCIVEIPKERWDWHAYFAADRSESGRHYSKWGGFISGVDEFDPLFFSISPREAQYIDPQERLFLQYAWMAMEDAGYTRAGLQVPHEKDLPGQVGVYVGVMWSEYQLFGAEASIPDRKMGFAGNVASIANRVSFVLNIHGPSVTLDTMCSSSLSAIHFACQDLKLGRTSMAIAGGVNVSVHPNKYLMLSVGQFISSDGHCQSFGEGGDGYIPGEGVGAVILKRLSDAKRDGDHIYGIIRGSALNHGGKTNGYTVPNPQAQASVIGRALAESGTDARHISYIEAHGTGTKLGDPIEIAALNKAFGQYTQDAEFCLIGSAKSNIGHCESAAGIAGLTKVLLQMQHRQIAPSLHSAQLNPHIDFSRSPFTVNQSLRPWEQPVIDGRTLPRIAGISSFGAGGSNAHMIIEEYQAPVQHPLTFGILVIPLSARTPEQLREKARDLLEFVRARLNSIDLAAMAYTLQVGREAMEERLALVVGSVEQLIEKLQAFLAEVEDIDDAYLGQVKRNKEALSLFSADDLQLAIDNWIAGRKFSRLADLWARGLELDWNKLYDGARPSRISLPAYPFAKERYWIDLAASKPAAVNGAAMAALHPLLQSNTSDLNEQRYSSTFDGDEFFLADHQVAVNGQPAQKVLPAVAYLEMVRAAMEHASSGQAESTALELRNVVWAQPIVVTDSTQVSIALSSEDGQIDYEIYSQSLDDEIVHGQGRAFFRQPAPAKLDLEQLGQQMDQGSVEPGGVYAACARMGLIYGPAFRGITAIERGNGQVLAHLRLPDAAARTSSDYVLHPSVMDSALQASVALIDEASDQPRVPFALESLLISAPCTAEMVAWVRHTPGAHNLVKLDIDLCDERGNVCVQMRGLSLRTLSLETRTGSLVAIPVWQASTAAANNLEFAESHVLSLRAEPKATIAQWYSENALACFERIQTILRNKPQGRVLLQVVANDDPEQSLLAGLSGLLKTAALENPQFAGQILLVPAEMTHAELQRRLQEEKALGLDPVVRYEQGNRLVAHWQEVAASTDESPIAFKDHGVYLITGGLGALGMLFAKEILEQARQARVLLTGRSPLSAENQIRLEGLSADRLSYRQVDLADLDQVTRLIADIRNQYGQLDGILHSAGMTADNFILKKSGAEFSRVLTPKVTGTFNLDQATKDVELDFFVLFSSFAGAMGNVGQADYAAANGFMDQFAVYRNRGVAAKQRHGRTRSINWPLWQAGGMSLDQASLELLQQTTGMHPMQTTTGMRAFHRSVELPYDQVLVIEGDLTRMRLALAGGASQAAARSMVSEAPVAGIDSGSLMEKTQEYFRRQFSDLLKVPAHKIDAEAALEQYGIDSVLAMQLINRLEQTFGSLSKTLFFEYQTIRELGKYFVANHAPQLAALFTPAAGAVVAPPSTPIQATRISRRRSSRTRTVVHGKAAEPDSIAIIGLSGRYPEAFDLDAYWKNLSEGKDCIIEVPKDRWDWQAYFSEDRTRSGRHYSKWGGFIAGVDEFDPLFFNIAPKEAKAIDPQERLFLQHAWMAIEDAGYSRASLQLPYDKDLAGQVGVYVGVMWSEYQLYGAEGGAEDARMGFAGSLASIANRVSYALDVHGPSMTLDTMCSSSMTAIHLACQDLKSGRTSLAIAGGVNVSIHPNKYLVLSAGQFISSDGHCQSFGEGGDGYIPGEGVGVVILKRLSEAERDGDHVYGVIRGSALNHGGKTNGYTVPNPQAQASVISRALAESHTDARHVSYIEAHGTGTKLGDPIEIAALGKAFDRYTKDDAFCLIGSAKSNIGHCESAAGIAGLTKVLLQMQHRQIVPSLHSAQLNPYIDFANSPFVVNQALRPWEQPVIDGRTLPRIAGISSFGAGGSNAHMIVEEYQSPVQQPAAVANAVIVLSARTAEQLQQKARDLLEFIRPQSATLDLGSIAYTLQVGRDAMDERLAFVVSSVQQLAEKLQTYVAGVLAIEDAYYGQVRRNREAMSAFSTDADLQQTVDKWIAGRKLARLADMWVKGLELDWARLYGEVKPRRISLPTYPFARERYWIDVAAGRQAAAIAGLTAAVLHPLLHSNTSDLSEQRYSSTFTGDEIIFADRLPGTNGKVLPAVACLEMARAAIEHASPARPDSTVLELHNTVWMQPIVVAGKKEVGIALIANQPDQIDYEIFSRDGDDDVVHCQGQAIFSQQSATAPLDLAWLEGQMGQGMAATISEPGIFDIRRGNAQLLAHLRLSNALESSAANYVLHPSIIGSALQAAAALIEAKPADFEPQTPLVLESLRVMAPCSTEMVAWVRYAPGSRAGEASGKLDLDLCDPAGNVAAQMRGLSWQASLDGLEPVKEQEVSGSLTSSEALDEMPLAPLVRKEIVIQFVSQAQVETQTTSPAPVGRKRPAIALASVDTIAAPAVGPVRLSSPGKPAISLASATAGTPVQRGATVIVSPVKLYECGNGVYSIEIPASRAKDMVAHVLQALSRVQREASLKVLMLSGIEHCFSRTGREEYNEAVERKLFRSLASFSYPVIAVLQGDVIGAGFMGAALCDFMVCNEDAQYGYTDAEHGIYPTSCEATLFNERFGAARAQDFLYVSTPSTGGQLRAKGWACPILPWTQVELHAEQLALSLAAKSQDALRLLKQHLTRDLTRLVEALTTVETSTVEQDRSDSVATIIVSPSEQIELDASTENVLVISFADAGQQMTAENFVADLGQIFARAQRAPYYKAIVLAIEHPEFVPGAETAVPDEVVLDLRRLLVDSEIPIVAAVTGNINGNAWLIAQSCDAAVYSRQGVHAAGDIAQRPLLAQTAIAVFSHRFGIEAANEILLTGGDYSGVDLQHRAGVVNVAEHDDVLPAAVRLAASLASLPRATVAIWKQQNAATIQHTISTLPAVEDRAHEDEATEPLLTEPTSIALQSRVISATAHPRGIVVVKMKDREAKNMFSDALIEGVREAFAHIARTAAYKVVILTGYDSYFASGGTKDSLLAIQEGKARFTDSNIFQVALDCELPVIAAMQGHGIGAGWSMGMFADLVLMSDESRYVSPYMNYGFTPGAGATWSLVEKMGPELARESLLTAQQYAGRELKERGLTLRVLPRAELHAAAMALAEQIARLDRESLIGLKRQLTAHVHQPLEETYRRELAMHDETFVGRSDTLAQIQSKFHQEAEAPSVETPEVMVVTPTVEVAGSASPSGDGDLLRAVSATLRTLLANELLVRESDIDDDAQFVDLGLDSISGVTWIRKINETYQTSIEATKVYSYPTLRQLSRYVKTEAEARGTLPSAEGPAATDRPVAAPKSIGAPQKSVTPPRKPAATQKTGKFPSLRNRASSRFAVGPASRLAQPIAIIGMAGQFPQAKNLDEFWQNIADGRNCITAIPPERWDLNIYYRPGDAVPGKTNSQWAGSIDGYDLFDPLFFNISPTEAEDMDPQQRLFLQACWHSIENAGYNARTLSGSRCGVFVGCGTGDYHQLSRERQLSALGFTGNSTSILAARISYFLNLQGPCVSIDTACSSSLVSIAQACDSLTSGGSDLALAGGVYVMTGPEMHIKTSQVGMLSPDGKCYSFDQRANGFVPGEGVGVVLLKRLADAQRDRDIIHAVIHGWAVNQDGKTNGITAPNPESQTRLEQEVYEKFRIDPADIQLIEAHGTGTKLGDPIEVEGLTKAFTKYTKAKEYCALGSVKSNIGHCLTAAGIAGVLKLVLALKHKQLPPTINFEHLNEHIALKDSPFYVNPRLREWESGTARLRQAATSSFGFSGTNAHMVIGEYVPPMEVKRPVAVITQDSKAIIPLSARTAERLDEKARDLLEFLRRQTAPLDLVEVAYTLQVGREAMDERLGIMADSVEQLAEKLEEYIRGQARIEGVYRGAVKRGRENTSIFSQDDDVKESIVAKWIANRKLSKLLELWVGGLELDWTRLYGEAKPQRIALPLYPFAEEHYWIEAEANQPATAILHPLLHRNTSDLNELRYSATWTGDEPFLTDHRVHTNGQAHKVLPGVAYLEMARAAIAQATPNPPDSSIVELHNTIWLEPVVVTEQTQVSISLLSDDDGRIDYEVYSLDGVQHTVHCQGQAELIRDHSASAKLDLARLSDMMDRGRLEAAEVYAMFAKMGLDYGPAHQGITSILLGTNELLGQLRLPAVVEASQQDYVLHPSMMDSALQASIGLIVDTNGVPTRPFVPFAVDSVRVVSPCTTEMMAWVRYAKGTRPDDKTITVDIDLCDLQGRICVQLRGFALRAMEGEAKPARNASPMLHVKGNGDRDGKAPFDRAFYQRLVIDVVNRKVSVDEAAELG